MEFAAHCAPSVNVVTPGWIDAQDASAQRVALSEGELEAAPMGPTTSTVLATNHMITRPDPQVPVPAVVVVPRSPRIARPPIPALEAGWVGLQRARGSVPAAGR